VRYARVRRRSSTSRKASAATRIVERAFDIGAGALAEAVAIIGERLEPQPA